MNARMGLWLASAAALGVACSQASLPPGTPPPEYEMRPLEPWPPVSAAPPAPVEPAAAPPPAQAEPVSPPFEGANDAGVPDLPDAALDAAPSTGAL